MLAPAQGLVDQKLNGFRTPKKINVAAVDIHRSETLPAKLDEGPSSFLEPVDAREKLGHESSLVIFCRRGVDTVPSINDGTTICREIVFVILAVIGRD